MCVWVLWNDLFHSQGPLKGTKMVTSTFYNFPLFSFILSIHFLAQRDNLSKNLHAFDVETLQKFRSSEKPKKHFFSFFFCLFSAIQLHHTHTNQLQQLLYVHIIMWIIVRTMSPWTVSIKNFFASATKTKRKCGKFMCRQKSCQKFTLHWFHKRKIKLYIFFAEANLYQQHSNWKKNFSLIQRYDVVGLVCPWRVTL